MDSFYTFIYEKNKNKKEKFEQISLYIELDDSNILENEPEEKEESSIIIIDL